MSHSLTIRRPLRLSRLGPRRFSVDGTPTDCVLLGVHEVLKGRAPDLVLSGINMGANLGEDIGYSGTVAAAMEACLLGLRAVAISLDLPRNGALEQRPRWETCAHFLPGILRTLAGLSWPEATLINVNIPDLPHGAVSGIRAAHQGRRKDGLRLERRSDPEGRPYWWILDYSKEERQPRGSDLSAVNAGAISVTPVTIDVTARGLMPELRAAFS